MKFIIILLFTSNVCLICDAQIIAASNNNISIKYAFNVQKFITPEFTAHVNNLSDALNGVTYNYGNAMTFDVSSPYNYTVRISSRSGNSLADYTQRNQDIRNFIFFNIADNNTGGRNYSNDIQLLGSNEKTLLYNCPPTRSLHENIENHYRTFSLVFTAKLGCSIPPGNYITSIIITATSE